MTLPIVGARHRAPADTILNNLPAGQTLILVREPENQYDANAVKVCLPADWQNDMPVATLQDLQEAVSLVAEEFPPNDEYHLGYVPRDLAAVIAPKMDEEMTEDGVAEVIVGRLVFDPAGRPVFDSEEENPDTDATPTIEDAIETYERNSE